VNIADDLDEYLHTLEELADKDEHVNFAQAALLITGSTNVFGKKVESLYELVFATLEATAAATGQPVPAPMRKANNKESDVAQSYVDEFLLLDDVIPVADEDDLALADEQRASDRGLVPQAPLALSGARTEGTTASLAMSTWIPPSSGAEDGDEAFRASQHRENDEQDASYVSAGDDMNMADDNDDYVHGAPSLLPAPPPPPPPPPPPAAEGAWVQLDPDASDRAADKPFKKGKTHVMPACFVDGDVDFTLPATNDSAPCVLVSNEATLLDAVARVRLGQYIFDEFKRAAPTRKTRPSASAAADEDEHAMAAQLDDSNATEDHNESHGDASSLAGPQDDMNLGDDEPALQLSSEQVAEVPESYSDLVRAHVARFLEQARNWAQESKLAVRVRAWQDHIEPMLREQEARPVFDIQASEATLMRDLQPGAVAPFASLVRGEEPWGTSRLFLAALQLSNEGCIELRHDERCVSEAEFAGTELDVVCKSVLKLNLTPAEAPPRKKASKRA